ncbi:fungal-specific transcription factor domain-containing protein [Mycena maculata]|uniref:Fungal-specific transcription factor domain-containing protein n=1 Tax=Mycena maculata TaxID=230809 RepID=A0AAD7P052_9AGAR|nr:fungal-specific transcription factor domain-containing protein [Mycena maculata]
MSSEDPEEHSPPTASHSQIFQRRTRRPHRRCERATEFGSANPLTFHVGDGLTTPNGNAASQCSQCLEFGVQCTYLDPTRNRGPKVKLVEELRQQIAALEAKLRSLSVCSLCAQPLQSQQDKPSPPLDSPAAGMVSTGPYDIYDIPKGGSNAANEEDREVDELVENLRQISIVGTTGKFFGLSSSYALLTSAIAEKVKYMGPPIVLTQSRRQVYWELLPWEKELYEQQPHYVYPATDLIDSLVELYFTNVHPILPVLHRPSFEKSVAEGLYLKNQKFGVTLLAVLAVASRYSDDPRVYVDGETSLSSGWKFIAQVEIARRSLQPTIDEVQFCFLMTVFSLGTSAPQVAWLYLGLGIRWIQQRGEYHRGPDGHDFEDELWNRAFWSFYALDRIVCSFVGRPPALRMDYDVEPLLEVDDEYWEQGFTQPLGVPSLLSYFICFIRLCEVNISTSEIEHSAKCTRKILGDTQYRVYASQKLRTRMGWTDADWEQHTVAELDSAMNDFFDSIPSHLRRDPNGRGVFLDQSTTLYTMYYYIQIIIHRPYIHKQSPVAAPHLSICTRAARSALDVAKMSMDKLERLPSPWLLARRNFVFASAVILLLNIFGSKRAGLAMDPSKDLAQVGTAMEILKFAELRSHRAGRLWDLINELQSLDRPAPRNEGNHSTGGSPGSGTVVSPPGTLGTALPHPVEGSAILSGATVDQVNGQHGQSFEPGMSIEQLLAETEPSWDHPSAGASNGLVLDDDVMSMWMTVPTDLMNINQWDTYMESVNGADADWSAAH